MAALVSLSALSTTPAVHAKEPSAQDLETARSLFNEGNELHDKGDLHGALKHYLAADELARTTVTGLMVGRTYLELGKVASAYTALRAVARIPEDPKDSANVKSARADADALAKETAPRVPYLVIRADIDVPSAEIVVDGAPRTDAKMGEPFGVDPGKHELVVRVPAHAERSVDIDAHEGEKQVVVLTYAPPKPKPPPSEEPTSSGTPISSTQILVYGGFGVAAVGLVVGAVTGAMTLARAPGLRDQCPGGRCPPEVHDERASVTRLGKISNVAFITAGCGALAGVLGFLSAPKSAETPSGPQTGLRITPTIGFGAIGLEGSF